MSLYCSSVSIQNNDYAPPVAAAPQAVIPTRSPRPNRANELFPIELFLARFPEFTNTDPNIIYFAIREASNQCPELVWGRSREDGAMYLTAHLLASRNAAISYLANINNPSKTASITQDSSSLYNSTLYGIEFARIQLTLAITGFTV